MIFSYKTSSSGSPVEAKTKRRNRYRYSRELSTGGVESGEILAQRPHVELGGPKGKISELL
jgi:hypothetical protein